MNYKKKQLATGHVGINARKLEGLTSSAPCWRVTVGVVDTGGSSSAPSATVMDGSGGPLRPSLKKGRLFYGLYRPFTVKSIMGKLCGIF